MVVVGEGVSTEAGMSAAGTAAVWVHVSDEERMMLMWQCGEK